MPVLSPYLTPLHHHHHFQTGGQAALEHLISCLEKALGCIIVWQESFKSTRSFPWKAWGGKRAASLKLFPLSYHELFHCCVYKVFRMETAKLNCKYSKEKRLWKYVLWACLETLSFYLSFLAEEGTSGSATCRWMLSCYRHPVTPFPPKYQFCVLDKGCNIFVCQEIWFGDNYFALYFNKITSCSFSLIKMPCNFLFHLNNSNNFTTQWKDYRLAQVNLLHILLIFLKIPIHKRSWTT